MDEMLKYQGFALIDTVRMKRMEEIKGNKLAMMSVHDTILSTFSYAWNLIE